MEPFEIIVLVIGIGVVAQVLIAKIPPASEFWAGDAIFWSKWAIMIYFVILLPILWHFNKKWHYKKFNQALERQKENEQIEELAFRIEKLLDEETEYMNSQEIKDRRAALEEALSDVQSNNIEDLSERINKEIEKVDREYPLRLKREKVWKMEEQEKELKSKLYDLKW